MNRRGFIGTLTALAGLTLAKIKAPAAPIVKLQRAGVAQIAVSEPITGLVQISNDIHVFTKTRSYIYTQNPDGMWHWKKRY